MNEEHDSFVFDTNYDRYPVAVHVILDDGVRVLLMRRAGSIYGEGKLAFPAGHVDLGEVPTASAVREAREELGIEIQPDNLIPCGVMFRRSLEPRVDIFFWVTSWKGNPMICEPDRCTELVWVDPRVLPNDTLDFVGAALENYRSNNSYDEFGWNVE